MSSRKLTSIWCVPVALFLLGCGGDAADDDKWFGNWNRTGTQSTTCGLASSTNQLTGLVVISAGRSGGTIQTFTDNCTTVWNVSGNQATLQPGQMCTVSVNGFNVTVTGTQGTANHSGTTITGTQAGSTNNGCSFMQQMTLTKM